MPKELKNPINIIPFLPFHRHFCHIKKVLRNQEGRRKKGTKKGEREKLRGVGERKNDHNKKYRPNSGCWAMSYSVINLFFKADAFLLKKNLQFYDVYLNKSYQFFLFIFFLYFLFILHTNPRSLPPILSPCPAPTPLPSTAQKGLRLPLGSQQILAYQIEAGASPYPC